MRSYPSIVNGFDNQYPCVSGASVKDVTDIS